MEEGKGKGGEEEGEREQRRQVGGERESGRGGGEVREGERENERGRSEGETERDKIFKKMPQCRTVRETIKWNGVWRFFTVCGGRQKKLSFL